MLRAKVRRVGTRTILREVVTKREDFGLLSSSRSYFRCLPDFLSRLRRGKEEVLRHWILAMLHE